MNGLDLLLGTESLLSVDEARTIADDPDTVRRHQAQLLGDLRLLSTELRGGISISIQGDRWSIIVEAPRGFLPLAHGRGLETLADEITRRAIMTRRRIERLGR